MRIDAHAHVISDAYRDYAAEAGIVSGGVGLADWSLDAHLEFVDRYRIDMSLLSPGDPAADVGDPNMSRDVARMLNEYGAEIVRDHPDRFRALAALPLSSSSGKKGISEKDVEGAVLEVAHAYDELDLSGVLLASSVAGIYPGDPVLEPLLDELNRREAYVFIHPTTPLGGPSLGLPPFLLDFPFETTRAVTSLLYSGALDKFPGIKFQLAHAGGAVPFLLGRISVLSHAPDYKEKVPAGVDHYLSQLFYDTAMADNWQALEPTMRLAGPDRIVFGTDYPYTEPDLAPPPDAQPVLDGLEEDDRKLIESGNALKLVPGLGDSA